MSIPPDVKKGETVNINVVIRASEPTSGTLQIFQKADNYRAPAAGNEKPVPVELQRGVNVFTLKQLITEPNFYTFTAEFIPDKDSGDKRAINNVAEGFTHARGKAQVLLIEGTRGEHAELVKALREKEIEVKPLLAPKIDGSGGVGGDPLPTDLAQLQPYDAVILANVPKEAFTESAAPAPGLELPRHGGRPDHARRPRQLRRRRLDEHAGREGPAGRHADQGAQGPGHRAPWS